jgi:threonine dehydrogenase-like Zn-dependent dehydrogenase
VKLPVGEDSALLPSLLTLPDVFCTGHHAAVQARVGPHTTVTVIGDGAVGLSAVLAARRLAGTIDPGRVFDRTVSLEEVPNGYRAMASRDALKVLIRL